MGPGEAIGLKKPTLKNLMTLSLLAATFLKSGHDDGNLATLPDRG